MKRLFMTMSRGFLSRNILQTDIYKTLLKKGISMTIATPAYQDPEFLETFSHPGVEFISMEIPAWNWKEKFFGGLHHNLIWSRTTRFTATYGVYDPDLVKPWRLWLQLLWRPFTFPVFRKFARWLDARMCPPQEAVLKQLREAKPDLVFLTNPMESWDSYYTKAAKQLGIPTVGLVKSWDNMSKTSFRAPTDDVIVWGPYMNKEARLYQDYKPEHIHELGVPQFDVYVNREGQKSREEMLKELGLDPSRKTVLFGSEGKVTPHDPEIVDMIAEMIRKQDLPVQAQVWVRPHYGYKNDDQKFDEVEKKPHVAVDRHYTPRPAFYDGWDFSAEHFKRLPETLLACDVMVTTASTLAIDAAACGLPVISIAFDGYHQFDHRHSVARWYETEYYSHVLETGALTVVHNSAELRAALDAVLTQPKTRLAERQALVQLIAGNVDGHAGARIGDYLANYESKR